MPQQFESSRWKHVLEPIQIASKRKCKKEKSDRNQLNDQNQCIFFIMWIFGIIDLPWRRDTEGGLLTMEQLP